MSQPITTPTFETPIIQPQVLENDPPAVEVPTFLQTAGKVTKVIFASLAALLGIASFCVGIAFTPFSPEGGMAAFAIGTSLFGLTGVLLFNAYTPSSPDLSDRNISSHP